MSLFHPVGHLLIIFLLFCFYNLSLLLTKPEFTTYPLSGRQGMRGADTLIPARFLTLIGHLCVMITLLWESRWSATLCLPNQHHQSYFQSYHDRLVAGFGASIALILLELTTFMLGLTMFSPSVSLLSTAAHGLASVFLTYFMLDGWLCDWYWPIFVFCSVLPSLADTSTAITTTTSEGQQLTGQHQPYKGGWSFYLVLAGFATTFGSSVPVGYNIGVVNTPAEVIKQFCNDSVLSRYDVTLTDTGMNVLWSSVVSIFIVGGCTGSVLGSLLADRLGRKKATLVTSFLSLLGAICFVSCRLANSVEMLVLGRLLVGLAGGLTTSIVPMYLTELAPPALTGAMGVVCPMGVNVGVLVGQVMGLDFLLGHAEDWPYLLAFFAILVIVCLPMLLILPDSPKYLFVVKRNEDVGLKELSRLRGVSPSILTAEVSSLRDESAGGGEAGAGGEWGMMRVLKDKRLRLPLLLTCSMQAGQQTSGINAVFYYSTTIFKQAGLSPASSQYATIGSGFINVCTAVLMLKLLPRVGRRPLLLGSCAVAAVVLTALAVSIKCIELSSWMPVVCMTAVLVYVLVYGLGLGPIPYFIASEMFSVGPRPGGMAWGSLANWGGNFLVGMSFPSMRQLIGPYSFLVFAAVTAALFVFQKMYFPETKGKTPNEVAQLCSHGFKSRPLDSGELHANV